MIHTKNAATPNSSPCCPVCGYTFAGIEVKFGNLTIVTSDLATYVSCEDNPDVHFTHSESVILAVLAMAKGRVVPKTMLYDQLYRSDSVNTDPKILDVYLCKIRKKIALWNLPVKVTSVWGRGWMLNPPDSYTENNNASAAIAGAQGSGA